MVYLDPSEYVAYGLSSDTADAWVAAASAMIDAHCRKKSLLAANYTERLRLDRRRTSVQLSYGPVISITSVQARFAPLYTVEMKGLAPCAAAFGLPGSWLKLDPTTVVLDGVSGEVQLPVNLLGLPYSEAEISYVAGEGGVPLPIKTACAQIVKNAQATPGMNVRSSKLDTLQTEYFSDSLLDSGVRTLLRAFVAERLG